MPDVETSAYAVISGAIRRVKVFPGGVLRNGTKFLIAAPFNPKKSAQQSGIDGPKKMLIDPRFVATNMEELKKRLESLRQDTITALTHWETFPG